MLQRIENPMDNNQLFRLRPIDWRWFLVSFCFLVIFHLFPAYLMGAAIVRLPFSMRSPSLGPPIWIGLGVFIVSAYVGFRSRGQTILEPGLASALYTLMLLAHSIISQNIEGQFDKYLLVQSLFFVLVLLLAFLVGCAGAASGEWLQLRKEKTQAVDRVT